MTDMHWCEGGQLEYQLDAIQRALRVIINELPKQATQITVCCVDKQILLCCEHNVETDPDVQPLSFSPLFPGSYTQADIAVRQITAQYSGDTAISGSRHGTDHPSQFFEHLCPVEPALHFARFDPLTPQLKRVFRTRQSNTVAVLPDNKHVLLSLEQLSETLQDAKEWTALNRTLIVVSMIASKTKDRVRRDALNREFPRLRRLMKSCGIQVHHVPVSQASDLMALLSKCDFAFVPCKSLAQDALNASCASQVYGKSSIATQQVKLQTNTPQTGSSMMQASLSGTEKQTLPDGLTIAYLDQMRTLIRQWVKNNVLENDADTWTAHQSQDLQLIIPASNRQDKTLQLRYSSFRAKQRKLLHSPRQFMQDSRYSSLRMLGRLPIRS